jgi:hypothetical protein
MPLASVAVECVAVEVADPPHGPIADSRPQLSWQPLAGVEHYRLRLRARVPEGEQTAAIDTLVQGASFRPPRPLTDYRALVEVWITSPCAQPVRTEPALRFEIDTGLGCVMPALTPATTPDTWTWSAATHARAYEVLRYAMPQGRLVARTTSVTPLYVRLPDDEVLAVRARCVNGYSALGFAP